MCVHLYQLYCRIAVYLQSVPLSRVVPAAGGLFIILMDLNIQPYHDKDGVNGMPE